MTQPDSPDFEFDLANLELDGDEPSAPKDGGAASSDLATEPTIEEAPAAHPEASEGQRDPTSTASEEDALVEEARNFDIAFLPDAFSDQVITVGDAQDASPVGQDEATTGEAERIESPPERASKLESSTRPLGADDLGADVFSEIEDEALTFEDVLDDLLDEVDTYELGGEREEEESEGSQLGKDHPDFLNFQDPDDSVAATSGVKPYRPDPDDREEAMEVEVEASIDRPEDAAGDEGASSPAGQSSTAEARLPFDEIPADDQFDEPEADAPDAEETDAEQPEDPAEGNAAAEPAVGEQVTPVEDEGAAPEALDSPPTSVEESEGAPHSVSTSDQANPSATEAFAGTEGAEGPLAERDDLSSEADETPGAETEKTAEDPQPQEPAAEENVDSADPTADAEAEVVSMPSAEDLLKRAGGLLNKNPPPSEEPIPPAEQDSEEGEGVEDAAMPAPEEVIASAKGDAEPGPEDPDDLADDELVAMPDPQDLVRAASGQGNAAPDNEAGSLGDEEDEIAAMPDPLSLIAEAEGAADAATESAKPAEKLPGNVADRGGNLPPPPPAPVEIIDDDPLDEDPFPAAPAVAAEVDAAIEEQDDLADPFGGDTSLDGFNVGLDEADAFEDALLSEETEEEIAALEGHNGFRPLAGAAAPLLSVPPRPRGWRRLANALALAAGLALFAAGWSGYVWKQEILEYFAKRDLDASSLISEIQEVGIRALEGFGERSLYRMQWMESEVRRVAENEIRLKAIVGARLVENLYQPVPESALAERFAHEEDSLLKALAVAEARFPEQLAHVPRKPWDALYRLSATEEEVLPLQVTYRIARADEQSDWELAGVRVRGHNRDLEWPEGQPKLAFGENAYDVDSPDFHQALARYRKQSSDFVASIAALRASTEAEAAAIAQQNREHRERVLMSLGEGAFFTGMAIVGDDGAEAETVTLVITESREKGALVRGVIQADTRHGVAKHFVGSVNFVDAGQGHVQGLLNLTTIAFDGERSSDLAASFFDPSTVSRMRLKTDGFRMEGDLSDFSLRMTRNL